MAAVELDRLDAEQLAGHPPRPVRAGRALVAAENRGALDGRDRVERPRLRSGAPPTAAADARPPTPRPPRSSRGRSSASRPRRRASAEEPSSSVTVFPAKPGTNTSSARVAVGHALPRLGQQPAEEDEMTYGPQRRDDRNRAGAERVADEDDVVGVAERVGGELGVALQPASGSPTRAGRRRRRDARPLELGVSRSQHHAPCQAPCTSANVATTGYRSTWSEPFRSPSTRSRSRSPMWSSGTGASASMKVTPSSE